MILYLEAGNPKETLVGHCIGTEANDRTVEPDEHRELQTNGAREAGKEERDVRESKYVCGALLKLFARDGSVHLCCPYAYPCLLYISSYTSELSSTYTRPARHSEQLARDNEKHTKKCNNIFRLNQNRWQFFLSRHFI